LETPPNRRVSREDSSEKSGSGLPLLRRLPAPFRFTCCGNHLLSMQTIHSPGLTWETKRHSECQPNPFWQGDCTSQGRIPSQIRVRL